MIHVFSFSSATSKSPEEKFLSVRSVDTTVVQKMLVLRNIAVLGGFLAHKLKLVALSSQQTLFLFISFLALIQFCVTDECSCT